jgi:hypothetical protein
MCSIYFQHYSISYCQHPLQSVTMYVSSAGLKVIIQYVIMNHYDFCNTGKDQVISQCATYCFPTGLATCFRLNQSIIIHYTELN